MDPISDPDKEYLHETAMVTDKEEDSPPQSPVILTTSNHSRKDTWHGLEEEPDKWVLDYNEDKGNILRTKRKILAGQVVLNEEALIIHATKDKILKTCCCCGLSVDYVSGRLPPTFCATCDPPWKDVEIDVFCSLWPSAWKNSTVVHSLRILHTVCTLDVDKIELFGKLERMFPERLSDNSIMWNNAGDLVASHLHGEYMTRLTKLREVLDNQLININKITNANSFGYNVMGVYCKASIISHSCDPNCRWDIQGTNLTLHSIRDIDANEELTVCYVPLVDTWGVQLRRAVIAQRKGFICQCDRCLMDLE